MRRSLQLAACLAAGLALAACGIANGAGVPHMLYSDDVAFCRYCATSGDVCAEDEGGDLACTEFSTLMDCDAAQNLFFTWEEGGSFLTYEGGKKDLARGFSRDCPDGLNPYLANVLVFDPEYDARVASSWNADDGPAERADDVTLIDAEQRTYKPASWDSQVLYSNDDNDAAYAVEILFCLSVVFDDPVAVQVVDKAGKHSNAICFGEP